MSDFETASRAFADARAEYQEALVRGGDSVLVATTMRAQETAFVMMMRALGAKKRVESVVVRVDTSELTQKLAEMTADIAAMTIELHERAATIATLQASEQALNELLAERTPDESDDFIRDLQKQKLDLKEELENLRAEKNIQHDADQLLLETARDQHDTRIRELEGEITTLNVSVQNHDQLLNDRDELIAKNADMAKKREAEVEKNMRLEQEITNLQERQKQIQHDLDQALGIEDEQESGEETEDFESAIGNNDDVDDQLDNDAVSKMLEPLALLVATSTLDVKENATQQLAMIEQIGTVLVSGSTTSIGVVNFLVTKLATGMEFIDDIDNEVQNQRELDSRPRRTTSFFKDVPAMSSRPSKHANRLELAKKPPLEAMLLLGAPDVLAQLANLYDQHALDSTRQEALVTVPFFERVFGEEKFDTSGAFVATTRSGGPNAALVRNTPTAIDFSSELDIDSARELLGAAFVRDWARMLSVAGSDVLRDYVFSRLIVQQSFFKPLLLRDVETTLFEVIGARPVLGKYFVDSAAFRLPFTDASRTALAFLTTLTEKKHINFTIGGKEIGLWRKQISAAASGRIVYANAALALNAGFAEAGKNPLKNVSPVLLIIPVQSPSWATDKAAVLDFVKMTALFGHTSMLDDATPMPQLFGDDTTSVGYDRMPGRFVGTNVDKSVLIINGTRFVVESSPKKISNGVIIFVKSWEGAGLAIESTAYDHASSSSESDDDNEHAALVASVLASVARGDDDTATRAIDLLHEVASRGDVAARAYLTATLPRIHSALVAATLADPTVHDAADNFDELKQRLEQ